MDELTEDENEQALPTLAERSRLPLLRDLPLDPLTLCKVACSVERLTEYHDGERLSGTLTRIALRLLTSRSGRLMRECPIQDLVRLCEAAVRTDLQPVREMISLFCRRVVHHLNRLGQEDLSILGVGDCVTLVWALGELGVKYAPVEKDSLSPHRRLRLVTKLPFINKEQLVILSNPRVIKLVRYHRTLCSLRSPPTHLYLPEYLPS